MTTIAIIGTGLAGMTAAIALAQADYPVTLIGDMPTIKKDDRTTAILSPGIDYLKQLKLWSACSPRAIPLMTMELIDRDNSFIYDASETQLNEFGFNVPNELLRQTMIHAITKNKNITWIKENVADAKRQKKVWTLTTISKKKIVADLIIAADGRNSMMRHAAAIANDERDENQTALVAVLEASKAHHYTSVEWYRTGGPLTLVPMDGKKLAVVWCEDDATAQSKKNLSLSELSRDLTAITEQRYGTLTFLTKPQTWPIRPMKAQQLVKENVVLIGEAAHVMPPIGAQGFNTSVQDIKILCDCLGQGRRLGLTLTDAAILNLYERKRLKDITLRYHSMTRLNDLIRTEHPALALLRGIGLRSLRRFAPLKKRVMQFGLGHDPNRSPEDRAA